MMSAHILVEPAGEGWRVMTNRAEDEAVYATGGAAEDAARDLATRYASQGAWARVVIRLKDGSLGGQFVVPPTLRPDSEAA